MKQLWLSLSFGLLAMGATAQANQVRIYPSFSEYRQDIQLTSTQYTLDMNNDTLSNMISGSLWLEGVKVLQQLQTQRPSWLVNLEGKTVYLRENNTIIPVKLVRAQDFLIQDSQTGRYRNVSGAQLEYPTMPPADTDGGVRWQFEVDQPGKAVLSYLTRALAWSPRYVLNLDGDQVHLDSLADIRNQSSQAIRVDQGELIAGEVNLVQSSPAPVMMARMEVADAFVGSAPKVEGGTEMSGLQRYNVSKSFALPPQSVYTLPFVKPKLNLKRYVALDNYFNGGFSQGKLQRMYRFTSDTWLPAGPITVRDNNHIVGQNNLPNTSKNEQRELWMGADDDVSYVRNIKVTAQDKTSVTYKVNITFENSKDRAIALEYKERLDGNVTLKGEAVRTDSGLIITKDLAPNSKAQFEYVVTFKYQ